MANLYGVWKDIMQFTEEITQSSIVINIELKNVMIQLRVENDRRLSTVGSL